jgi:release factor glutamine methyltransferase
VWATDVDPEALAVARENGRQLGVDVEFVQADLLEGLDPPFDAVLANLPYVASGVDLPPEIGLYEPAVALFSGEDGLDLIRRLLATAAGVPLVALEVGLAKWVASLAREAGFRSAEILHDLAGLERVVVARH